MPDDIDESAWIKDEPVLQLRKDGTPWRSDLKIEYHDNGEYRFAQHQVRNILNFLWQESIITDQQHHDGQTFEIWRDMHRAAMGHKKPVSSGETEAVGIRLRAYGFVLLLQRLSRHDHHAIETAIETASNDHTNFIARQYKLAYSGVFHRLEATMLPIHQKIRGLESLSDEERESLSQEQLKIFLAKVYKRD